MSSKEALAEREKPFRFWVQEKDKDQSQLRQLKHKITMIKEELGHFGVPEKSIKKLSRYSVYLLYSLCRYSVYLGYLLKGV